LSRTRSIISPLPSGIPSSEALPPEGIDEQTLAQSNPVRRPLCLSSHRVGPPLFLIGGGIRLGFYGVADGIIVIVSKITLLEVAHDILWQQQRNTDSARLEDGLPEFLKSRGRVVLVQTGEHPARHRSDVEIYVVGRVLVAEVGSETTATETLRDGRIRQLDLDLNRGDVLRRRPLENYLADGAELLAIQLERNECDWYGKRASPLHHISDPACALASQGDADHSNGEDGGGTQPDS
jgi:hypothetical protein